MRNSHGKHSSWSDIEIIVFECSFLLSVLINLCNHSYSLSSNHVCFRSFFFVMNCTIIGFDEYYKSLRPRLNPQDCTQALVNRPHSQDPKLQINCRNIWFNEFWSQHHKCRFDGTPNEDRLPRCTGNETLTNYEQEGLVPFVGKHIIQINLITKKAVNFVYFSGVCVCLY